MPVAHGGAEPVLHPFAEDRAILVVDPIGELVRGVRAFIADRGNVRKDAHLIAPLALPLLDMPRCVRRPHIT